MGKRVEPLLPTLPPDLVAAALFCCVEKREKSKTPPPSQANPPTHPFLPHLVFPSFAAAAQDAVWGVGNGLAHVAQGLGAGIHAHSEAHHLFCCCLWVVVGGEGGGEERTQLLLLACLLSLSLPLGGAHSTITFFPLQRTSMQCAIQASCCSPPPPLTAAPSTSIFPMLATPPAASAWARRPRSNVILCSGDGARAAAGTKSRWSSPKPPTAPFGIGMAGGAKVRLVSEGGELVPSTAGRRRRRSWHARKTRHLSTMCCFRVSVLNKVGMKGMDQYVMWWEKGCQKREGGGM